MNIIDKYNGLSDEFDNLEKQIERQTGRVDQLKQQLKDDHNIKSLDAGMKKVKILQDLIDTKETDIQNLLLEIESKINELAEMMR